MNILFDVGHPAHVHLFKNFIFYLQQKKITFTVLTRNKEITNQLLNHYNIPFHSISSPRSSKLGMLFELCVRNFKILKFYLKYDYTLSLGTSVSIGHLTKLSRGKVISWNFNEDDDSVVPLYTKLAYPHSSIIINPNCLEFKHWKKKRVLHPSYHELAYLHPNNFRADENIIKKYGLKKNNYIVFRFSALTAHHDAGAKGISSQLKLQMTKILKGYDIVESFEGKRGNKIAPWDMHHILASAKMIISDSQTMTIEAAVLGVPSIRINTFIGKSTVIEELENKYKLCFGILPTNEGLIMKVLKELINNPNIESDWQLKLEKLLQEKVDFNEWLITYFESEIKQLND